MTQYSFGPGAMWGERIDVTGSGIGPRQFGVLQDVDVTFSYTSKELYGQEQFAAAVARGQGKITGKAKFAQINVLTYADIFFGLTSSAGQLGVAQYEPASVPASPAYTVTPANASTFKDDLGVSYSATGRRFNRVTTPTNAAEYSVNMSTGVYTFGAADAAASIRISYEYTVASLGRQIAITNQAQGTTPAFKATIFQKVSPGTPGSGSQSLPMCLHLNACVANSLSFPLAQDAWTIQNFDFSGFADASGDVGLFCAVEQ